MHILNRKWVRELDRLAMQDYHIPGVVLMENAGRGATDILCRLGIGGKICILCGKGNNAGDGLVIARHLDLRGHRPYLVSVAAWDEFRGDAAINAAIIHAIGLPWFQVSDATSDDNIQSFVKPADWIIDGLLGTGASGPLKSPIDRLIAAANNSAGQRVALDIPSGLDCDTGQAFVPTFRAAHTVTFAAAKPGLLMPAAAEYVGSLHLCDIGAPLALLAACSRAYEEESSV